MKDSAISKFFEKSRKERLAIIKDFSDLTDEELELLENPNGGISFEKADKMVENAIGTFSLPLGIATNFKINLSKTSRKPDFKIFLKDESI